MLSGWESAENIMSSLVIKLDQFWSFNIVFEEVNNLPIKLLIAKKTIKWSPG